MTPPPPPTDMNATILAANAARVMSLTYRMAYAQIAPDLSVVQHSPNFPELVNSWGSDTVNRPITDLLWEFVGAEEVFQEILLGKSSVYRLENVNRDQADGSVVYLNFQVTLLDERQPGHGLLLVVEDRTDYGRLQQALVQDRNELRLVQRQLTQANEELQRVNRLKSIFLSMAAHDLRTPLTAISGYASLMLDQLSEGKAPDIQHYLSIVVTQSDRLNRLISDFLDLDQIEEGRLTIEPEPCDLNEIVKSVTAVLQFNADARQITMKAHLSDAPLQLWADRDKIYRVIYNLVENAIKYTQRTGHVSLHAQKTEDQAILKVADNGRGMTAEQLGNLFQIYYRTEEAMRSKTSGTGLGLYIVKTLVEAHQGRIEVQSKPDHGSTFIVYLPLKAIPTT